MPSRAETTITLTDAPEDGERTVVMDGLRAYNEERAGVSDARQLAILARDPDTGEVVGGLLGRSYLGLLTVERFFRRTCAAAGSAAGYSLWRRKRGAGAAAPVRCCQRCTFRRRAST